MNTQSDFRIFDLASHNAVTAEPRQVARLYFYALVDPLIELAYRVSCDFFKRPQMYTKLGEAPIGEGKSKPLSVILAELHGRYGKNEFFPSAEQRSEIYTPIFGACYGSATAQQEESFPRLRDDSVKAATAFAERSVETGVDMLKENVRTTVRPFTNYLTGLHGDSLKWSADEALASLAEAVSFTVLRSSGVAGVFGFTTTPSANWPYSEDSNADKIVEEISMRLASDSAIPRGKSNAREYWSTLQRAAARGAEAIALITDFKETNEENLDLLITRVYTWGSALAAMNANRPDIIAKSGAPTPASGRIYYPTTKQ